MMCLLKEETVFTKSFLHLPHSLTIYSPSIMTSSCRPQWFKGMENGGEGGVV